MAWNTPGSDNSGGSDPNGRPPRQRKPDGRGLDAVLDTLRGVFGGGGGGILRWVALVLGLWLVFNCFVLVTEQERGVVLRFGQFARILQPGPHFKAPWPIERVTKVNATQSNAYSDNVPVLTRDGNIVNVEINVQYRIGDPQQYLYGSRDAAAVLQQAAQSAVREVIGRSDLDSVLYSRSALTTTVRTRLQQSLGAYHTGLVVTELALPNARPPDEVKDAFDEAQRASADKTTLINQAEAYAKKVVPEARGQAAQVRAEAEGYKTAQIARAEGDAARFSLLVDQYKNAPDVTRKRLWLETVQQVMSENRKIVGGDSRQLLYVPLPERRGAGSASQAPLLTPELLPSTVATPSESASSGLPRPARSPRGEEPTR
ncbi:FtsH protease activity modulator HflK [Lysobacter silvisoli]|uniref:Protein HflK n=1 Tax=Lysobacter silvisoli TaxID=2293254 RepID=A0A371K5J4_9GAMM|nr:FtsH protease activity modulator HflK [Lysobacter silvisoli]RDZ29144.1 FtsH protease activity modulator HflK [Lysobacter silvisoli]